MSPSHDAKWLETDDYRRFLVTPNGVRHIRQGVNAACGAGPVVYVLRPEEAIEFRCPQCFPTVSRGAKA